jgi:hypothetical protein
VTLAALPEILMPAVPEAMLPGGTLTPEISVPAATFAAATLPALPETLIPHVPLAFPPVAEGRVVQPKAFPFAAIPIGNWPLHELGVAARAVAVPALPVTLPALPVTLMDQVPLAFVPAVDGRAVQLCAFPPASTPSGNVPAEHLVGALANAVAVAALPAFVPYNVPLK